MRISSASSCWTKWIASRPRKWKRWDMRPVVTNTIMRGLRERKVSGASGRPRTGNRRVIFAILPVKSPQNAKQRLTGFLAVEQRETLARMLYRQTLAALCQAEGIDRVVVATSDSEIAEHARRSGALVFEENEQVSHSVSADAACLRAMEMGATTVLLVPIDVPTVTPADFTRLARSSARAPA